MALGWPAYRLIACGEYGRIVEKWRTCGRPIVSAQIVIKNGAMGAVHNMARKQRTGDELREASNHLHYEVWMLGSLAQSIASGIATQGWLTNALLESFVVHVRGVMDFLYNDNPQGDDVVAQDFFPLPDAWFDIRPKASELLIAAKKRAGKEIVHLTYARQNVTPETKPWRFTEIANEVTAVMQTFLDHVPDENLGSRWRPDPAE